MNTKLRPLTTEQLLIDELPDLGGSRAIVVSPGRAQFAELIKSRGQVDHVTAWFLDMHSMAATKAAIEGDIEIVCSTDLPEEPVDLVAIPVMKKSESELTRDLLQQAHNRLVEGGHLAVSVDNPKDNWLHDQLQGMLDKVTCMRTKKGCVYWGKKTGPLKKEKNFECQFKFRDEEGRMIDVISRPGVFSHRRLDTGARQLMLSAAIGESDTVLDMGCGAGSVALASAFKTSGTVFGVDGNARAVECLRRGADLNGLTNIETRLNSDGEIDLPCEVDLALANPPYFGDHQISKHFVETCMKSLRSAGALLVVTKQPRWYGAYFEGLLEDLEIFESSRYWVVCGRKS